MPDLSLILTLENSENSMKVNFNAEFTLNNWNFIAASLDFFDGSTHYNAWFQLNSLFLDFQAIWKYLKIKSEMNQEELLRTIYSIEPQNLSRRKIKRVPDDIIFSPEL